MVLQGRISVNDQLVSKLPVLIEPGVDRVVVDGQKIRLRAAKPEHGPKRGNATPHATNSAGRLAVELIYILLNKPKNVFSTNVAQGVQKRAIDLLPDDVPARVYPVGRLDSQSTGLLLMTNDGDLTHRLTHPRFGVAKTYRATVDGFVDDKVVRSLEGNAGVAERAKPGAAGINRRRARIRVVHRSAERTMLEITVQESTTRDGRHRSVRQMLAHMGHKVRELCRIRFGPLELGGMPPGAWRLLSRDELRKLRGVTETRNADKPPRRQDAKVEDT
jgi:pseudouridine synthase